MITPAEEQKKRAAHIHVLKAAMDKARQTGEPLKLKIGHFDAVYKNSKLQLKWDIVSHETIRIGDYYGGPDI